MISYELVLIAIGVSSYLFGVLSGFVLTFMLVAWLQSRMKEGGKMNTVGKVCTVLVIFGLGVLSCLAGFVILGLIMGVG